MVMNSANPVFFAPELFIPRGTKDISFYINAFNAVELRRWMNEDGSIHVAELSLSGAMFHLHEETKDVALFAPSRHQGSTALIGLLFLMSIALSITHKPTVRKSSLLPNLTIMATGKPFLKTPLATAGWSRRRSSELPIHFVVNAPVN